MNEMEFRQRAAELGYGEPQVKAYPPNATSELHAHDFSAFAMVADGEFILAFEDGDTTYARRRLRGGGRYAARRKVGSERRNGVVRDQMTRGQTLSEGAGAAFLERKHSGSLFAEEGQQLLDNPLRTLFRDPMAAILDDTAAHIFGNAAP